MTKKLFALFITSSLLAAAALAAPQRPLYSTQSRIGSRAALTAIPGEYNQAQRPLFTLENRLPDPGHLELGVSGGMNNIVENFYVPNADVYSISADLRLGVVAPLALTARIPYVSWELDPDDVSESGLGDIHLGAQFRAFEDIFEYPWIIVHGEVGCPTGDEDKGLGADGVTGIVGLSIGTTVEDVWHFIAVGSWVMNDDIDDDQDGFVRASLTVMWDLDEACSLMVEGRYLDVVTEEDESATFMGHAGISYDFGNGLSAAVYGGAATGCDNDGYGTWDSIIFTTQELACGAYDPTTLVNATMGTGTSQTSGVPVSSGWGNTLCQSIFYASELAAAGFDTAGAYITDITYNWTANSSYSKVFTIYMNNTTQSTYSSASSTYWVPTGDSARMATIICYLLFIICNL